MKNGKYRNILFVCTGNSCRSVMAEELLKHMVKKSDNLNFDEFKICSAGTSCMGNMLSPKETIQALSNHEIDIKSHRSQRLTPEMVKEADVVFAMQKQHKKFVKRMESDGEHKTYLLKEFCQKSDVHYNDLQIMDPIGGSLKVYEGCLLEIKKCLEKIIKKI